MSGVIRPDSEVQIEITFAPKVEKSYNYNILCQVKRKARPISLNIKGFFLNQFIYFTIIYYFEKKKNIMIIYC